MKKGPVRGGNYQRGSNIGPCCVFLPRLHLSLHAQPEAEWGFDRVLDLVRSRLSEPRSRAESAAECKSLRRGARKVGPSIDPPGGSGDGPSGSSINVVHRPGCPRLAHAQRLRLRLRPPCVPEKLPRDEDGSGV